MGQPQCCTLPAQARLHLTADRRRSPRDGVSDRYSPNDLPPLEDLVDDRDAVLDAAGSDRTALFGYSDAGVLCTMFAATRPDRVSGLILHAATARGRQAPDYPWQWSDEEWEEDLAEISDPSTGYGTRGYAEATLPRFAPSLGGDDRAVDWWERFQRHAASPSAVDAQERVFMKMDIRALLPAIGVPTLVVHRTDDAIEPVGAGRYLGQAIPNARYVELVGADHLPWAGDQDARISELERFLGQMSMDEEETLDRVLATVLFTDIVDSTAKAAGMGDRRWREVREQHDRQIAVAIGARIGAMAAPGEVLVSSTVKDLVVGSGLTFEDRGTHRLKGVPEAWHLYALGQRDGSGGGADTRAN